MKTIKTNVFGITVYLDEAGSGKLISDLRNGLDGSDAEYAAALEGLESLILAHACAGIDITTPAYLEGVETAVEAIANHF